MGCCCDPSPPAAPMPRADGIGVISGAALVVANMVGAGVFTTSGYALADLGSRGLVMAAWLIGGALATLGALCYAALARAVPGSGGEYLYLRETVHPMAGLAAGWLSLLVGFAAPVAVAGLALEAYLGTVLPASWLATAVIVAAGAIHGLQLRLGVAVQNVAVALKVLLLLSFIGIATVAGAPPSAPSITTGVGAAALPTTLLWVSFCYSGWNGAAYIAAEIRRPAVNVPRALLGGTAAVTILYVAFNAALLWCAPLDALAGRADVAAAAAAAIGGERLVQLTTALVALALVTSILAMVMAGARVAEQMARDGRLPQRFAARTDAPTAAVALQVAVALVCVWTLGLRELLSLVGFLLNVSAAATVAGLWMLRRRRGATAVPVVGYPWVPAGFIVGTTTLTLLALPGAPLIVVVGAWLALVSAALLIAWRRAAEGAR
jgi:amino acid transporter